VGDRFSLSIAKSYISDKVRIDHKKNYKHKNLILIGSLLQYANAFSYVCGAGFISSTCNLKTAPKLIMGIRGPLTRKLLLEQNMNAPEIYGDPGILAPEIVPPTEKIAYKMGIVPHYVDADLPWVQHQRQKGIPVIDVSLPLDPFFKKIQQCEIILSSSLHGSSSPMRTKGKLYGLSCPIRCLAADLNFMTITQVLVKLKKRIEPLFHRIPIRLKY